jgi:hypothetical protein
VHNAENQDDVVLLNHVVHHAVVANTKARVRAVPYEIEFDALHVDRLRP